MFMDVIACVYVYLFLSDYNLAYATVASNPTISTKTTTVDIIFLQIVSFSFSFSRREQGFERNKRFAF